MFRQGLIFKNYKFSLENEYLVLVVEWNSSKTDMTLSCSNNCIITRSNQKHVTPHNALGNPHPFLMESNLKLSKITRLHWTIRMRRQSSSNNCSIVLRSGLTKLTRFVLVSAHTWLPRQRGTYRFLDEENWLRLELEWKPIVWNVSFLEMTPCLYAGVQHERL